MPSIYQLKPRFQNLLRPQVERLYRRGVTANQVTLAAAGISLLVGALCALWAQHAAVFLLIPLWMFLRMALNAIDGVLAREFGQKSDLGAYLNELCDVIADSALFLPFALLPQATPLWVILACVLALEGLKELRGLFCMSKSGSARTTGRGRRMTTGGGGALGSASRRRSTITGTNSFKARGCCANGVLSTRAKASSADTSLADDSACAWMAASKRSALSTS